MQRRTILLLFSIANVLYLPGCRSVHGETTLNRAVSEAIDIKDQESVKVRPNSKEPYPGKEESSELLGRWRNNGEALEPKWRDGDVVPSFPFSHFAQTYSKEEEPDLISYENPYDSAEYRRFDDRGNDYVESHQNDRVSFPKDSRVRQDTKKYAGRNPHERFETKQGQTSIDSFTREKFVRNDRTISSGYRDAFQVRPNEYEHELADEEYLKPRPRKRRPPQNEEFVLSAKEVTMRNERIKAAASAPSTRIPPASNSEAIASKKIEAIKSLIKMQQEEGTSLSEILRRKNLTLIDLLKGKEDVISALKMEDIDEIGDDIEQISMAMTSTLAKLPSTTKPSSTFRNIIDTTVAPLSPAIEIDLEIPSKTKEIVTATTKSEPLHRVSSPGISIEFDQSYENTNQNLTRLIDEDEIMEFSDFTDYKKGRTTVSPIWISRVTENNVAPPMRNMNRQEGGSTLSIVRILTPTKIIYSDENSEKHKQPEQIYDHDDNDSSINDGRLGLLEDDYQYDAPSNDMQKENVRVSSSMRDNDCKNNEDLEEKANIEKSKERSNELSSKSTNETFSEEMIKTFLANYPNVEDTKSDNKRYEDIVSELEPEARAEIFELFSSGSGKKLQRLLESRNMSLEELIALRQRGSSRVHLAEVSRLRNQKALRLPEDEQPLTIEPLRDPEEKSLLSRSRNETIMIKSSVNEIERNINDATQFAVSSTFAPAIVTNTVNTTSKDLTEVSEKDSNLLIEVAEVSKDTSSEDTRKHLNETRGNDLNNLMKVTELFPTYRSLPFGKDHDQGFLENIEENIDDESFNAVQSGHTKEVIGNKLNTNASTVYEITNNRKRDQDESEDRDRSLSKIKSSIIASAAILGVTIVVFLTIFLTCRIRHRQKYRYRNSFPRTVFQSPMTTARKLSNTSSLNNIMVNVVATSTTKRLEKNDSQHVNSDYDPKCDIDNDSLDANDSWETIPDYMK